MLKFLKYKKGEMTVQQIVILIVLILSFAVILFFLLKLNIGGQTKSELCQNSVSMRANAPLSSLNSYPLNCQRQYLCLSKTGKCDAPLTNPTVERVSTKDDVYNALSENLANCWAMYGQGKLNYIGSDTLPKLYCSFCSQIAFDSSVKKIFNGDSFNKQEFYNYMSLTNMTGKDETYSEYIYGTNNFSKEYKGDFGKVNLNKQYYSLIGITSDVSTLGWVGIGAGLATASLLTGGIGALSFSAVAITSTTGGAIGGLVFSPIAGSISRTDGATLVAPVKKEESGNDFVLPSLIEVGSQQFNALGCQEIANKA